MRCCGGTRGEGHGHCGKRAKGESGNVSKRRHSSLVFMDKSEFSRKRRVEKTSWAKCKVQRRGDAGGNPHRNPAGSPRHRPQSDTWEKRSPRVNPAARGAQQHPQVPHSRMSQAMTSNCCGLSGGFSLGRLLHLGSSLVSNETDSLYRWKVRKYPSA